MIGRRILYAVLVAAAVLFQIFFRFYLSTFVLVLLIVLPVLSLLLSLPGLAGSRLVITPADPTIFQGENPLFHLSLHTASPFPLVRPRIRLGWTNQLTGACGQVRIVLPPAECVPLTIPSSHCGRLVCRAERVWSCDLLGLFPLPMRKGPEGAVLVLPHRLEPENIQVPTDRQHDGVVLRPRPGGGPGEDYDLREYRAGDSLRSVHWKLSSKLDELVVRETLEPRQAAITVTYNHFGTPEVLDRTFAQLCALSRLLLEQERPHHIQWADPLTGIVEDRWIDGTQALLACLELAFSIPAPLNGRSILDGTLLLPPGSGKVRHLHVTPDGVEGVG